MIKDYIAEGVFTRKAGETLLARLEEGPSEEPGKKDTAKAHLDAAGVKAKGKYVLGYETWTQLDLGDGEQRVCVAYFGGDDLILGCRRNPYWCDLLPIISAPVTRQSGSGKGVPLASYVDTMQYQANDYMNLGADSATYALLPIAMTDPVKNPFYSQMVATMGAVWPTAPNDTKIVEFPPLYQHALTLIAAVKAEIYETMSVNPSMIAQRPAGKKPTQAEIAAEQQIDILTVADVVGPAEESILTPIVERFVAYDAQFRTDEISVKAFGPEAVKASMEQVPPQQLGTKAVFTWYGVEQARNQQTMQLQMAGMNVLRNLPPQAIPGKRLNFVPLIEKFVENVFGPRMASKIFLDDVGEPPELENQFLAQFDLPVSPSDNDMQHMQVHQAALGGGDPHGFIRGHIHKHQLQMAAKNQAAAQAQQGGQPGQPGQARPGSMSTGPRQQGPAGMIHKDAIPLAQPRRAG
jgi:hypothetical protein